MDRATALKRYHAFSRSHRRQYESMYIVQQSIRHLHGRPLDTLARVFSRPKLAHWAFRHYLDIAPPQFAVPAPPAASQRTHRVAATAGELLARPSRWTD